MNRHLVFDGDKTKHASNTSPYSRHLTDSDKPGALRAEKVSSVNAIKNSKNTSRGCPPNYSISPGNRGIFHGYFCAAEFLGLGLSSIRPVYRAILQVHNLVQVL